MGIELPLSLIQTLIGVPSPGETKPLKMAHQCVDRYEQLPFCVFLLVPHFPMIFHLHCHPQQNLASLTPCLVCPMNFGTCGCGTELIVGSR